MTSEQTSKLPTIFVAHSLGKFMVNMASVSMVSDGRPLQHLKRDLEWLQQRLGRPINTDFVTKFAFEE
ncbi:hypothetical protein P3342_008433 [Pyrenophora teres f. teres]|nr:hypothetical protein P3342_008433 [Pyrenophora teres f. teres]